jgi:hypothetical protein
MVAVNNSLYVLGGYNFGTLSCIEEYDMGIETWRKVGELQNGVDVQSAFLYIPKFLLEKSLMTLMTFGPSFGVKEISSPCGERT